MTLSRVENIYIILSVKYSQNIILYLRRTDVKLLLFDLIITYNTTYYALRHNIIYRVRRRYHYYYRCYYYYIIQGRASDT